MCILMIIYAIKIEIAGHLACMNDEQWSLITSEDSCGLLKMGTSQRVDQKEERQIYLMIGLQPGFAYTVESR